MPAETGLLIRRQIVVPSAPLEAFRTFTEDLATWWPPEYSWSGDVLEHIGLEPREGGHCYEIGPRAFRCDWGTVLTWDPPVRLILAWQVGMDRVPIPNLARASEIEVTFTALADTQTQVDFEHHAFSRHGKRAQAYCRALNAPMGWTYILDRYASAVARQDPHGSRSRRTRCR